MNICLLTTSYPRYPGDYAGAFIIGQARALAANGHTVHVIAPHDRSVNTPGDEHAGTIHVHRFDYWFPHRWQALCYRAGIVENFRRNRLVAVQLPTLIAGFARRALPFARQCDVIHAHWSFAGLGGLIAGKLAGKPVVLTMHGAEALSKALRPLNRYLVRQTAGIVVNSHFTRDTLRSYAPAADPLVIPFGVNPEKIAPPGFDRTSFRRAVGLGDDLPVVLAVGRLVERKGFHVLIDAAAHLLAEMPVYVLIGGKGPEYEALQARIDTAGLGDHVRLLGYLEDDDLARWYAAADVFVLPAIVDETGDTEGLGIVLLEAMTNATPVVASRTGGITDIVSHNKTGLLATPGDPDDLAVQLRTVLSDPDLRERLRSAARRHVDDKFSWQAIGRRLCDLYESLVE
jgi:glycosyltransferase involved in cell wall biosynthesis